MKILRRKKSYFGRRVFIFVLPIRNKSPFSGKIKKFLQNWEDDVKFIGNMTKTQNRDANHLRWQKSTSLGIRVPGPEYRKMEHRETLWWGCCCKKNVKTIMFQEGDTLPLTRAPLEGGGYFEPPPPLISETTGPILKIQAAFESPGKTVEGKQILLTSGSRVTSQVRSKSKCSTFRAWWNRRAKLRC